MPVELLLLVLAWAAIVSLLVVLPWAVIRLAVGVLEADVSMPGADHEHAQPIQTQDAAAIAALSREPDEAVEPADVVPATGAPHKDTDRFHPKAVVREVYDAWNEGDFERVDDLVAAEAVSHDPMLAEMPDHLAGEKQAIQTSPTAFPDARIDIDEMIAEGDTVAIRWTGTGPHGDSRRGDEPTSPATEVMGLGITRVEEGQIVESWGVVDAPRGDNVGR